MNKSNFEILYEDIIKDIASLEEYETEPKLEYRSFNEFKHFCKTLDLICKLDEDDENEKVINCILYFMNEFDNENNQVKFDYFNQISPEYYNQYAKTFDQLNDFKRHYVITIDGTAKSPRVIWG